MQFLSETLFISIDISMKFIPNGPINTITALAQMMAWRWPDGKPLSEPMLIILLAHIDGLVQDCSNSIANALELLQSCTKPSIYASLGLRELTLGGLVKLHRPLDHHSACWWPSTRT